VMRTIKTYSNRAPFYNAFIRTWASPRFLVSLPPVMVRFIA
jgi:hypothetical protein